LTIPGLIIVKDGEIVDAFNGYTPGAELKERVEVMIED
jgi:thioredoxin-like negative regulator of GroEL